MPHDRMLATRHTYTWIHKYIFPGGLLPSVTAIEDSLARSTRLRITARDDFGPHYAETLRIWRDRFCAHADEVARLGFDEVFHRMWNFYLCYSEAGLPVRLHRRQPAHPGPHMTAPAAPDAARRHRRPGPDPCRPGPAGPAARCGTAARPGPAGAPVLVIRSPRALRRILWRPGELGLARAYISGDLDVDGDLTDGLRRVLGRLGHTAGVGTRRARWSPAQAAGPRWPRPRSQPQDPAWPPPPPPGCELRVRGRLHSRARDQAVIAGHYDVPAAFYQLILDPSMAYSCAYWTDGRRHPGRRAAGQAGADLRQARPASPAPGCSTWAAAGVRSPCTPPATTRPR